MSESLPKVSPLKLSIVYPEKSSRLMAFLTILVFIKPILLIPHFIVIYFLGVASLIAAVCAQFAVLFTGNYPRPLFMLNKAMMLWNNRLNSYFLGLTDQYPSFSFEIEEKEEAAKGLWWMIGAAAALVLIGIIIAAVSN